MPPDVSNDRKGLLQLELEKSEENEVCKWVSSVTSTTSKENRSTAVLWFHSVHIMKVKFFSYLTFTHHPSSSKPSQGRKEWGLSPHEDFHCDSSRGLMMAYTVLPQIISLWCEALRHGFFCALSFKPQSLICTCHCNATWTRTTSSWSLAWPPQSGHFHLDKNMFV